MGFNTASKTRLHELTYEVAEQRFNLNAALIQTARDRAVEILKSFNKRKRRGKAGTDKPGPKRVSIRFDGRCYKFSKTGSVLTPYWLMLSLNKDVRISLPIVFEEKQRQMIEGALRGE